MRRFVLFFVCLVLGGALGNDDPEAGRPFCCAPTMVSIAAPGAFTVGSPVSDIYRVPSEVRADISISYGWRVSSTEITVRQYRALMGDASSFFTDCDDCPKDYVTWYEATGYADALSAKQGLPQCYGGCFEANRDTVAGLSESGFKACYSLVLHTTLGCAGYRLPTAGEFEWMSRDGDFYPDAGVGFTDPETEACAPDALLDSEVVWCRNAGSDTSGRPGNCTQITDPVGWDGGPAAHKCVTTLPVETMAPNGLGLYGIKGNLYEWTHSNWCANTWDLTDPTGDECPDTQKEKRGGSYIENAKHQRHSMRSFDLPTRSEKNIGFRVVLNGAS